MPRGYQNYRGRRSAAIKLLIVVLVVTLISACTFLFIQRFITYTDDGKMRIDLPQLGFFQKDKEQQKDDYTQDNPNDAAGSSTDVGQEVNLIIDEPDEQTPDEPDPPAPAAEVVRHLVQMDTLPSDGTTLKDMLANSSANGFVWRVRENTGVNRFASDTSLRDALANDAVSAETLTELCGVEGVTSVALFNCFHDSYFAYVHMRDAAICQSNGYVWFDKFNYYWLDPSKELARTYVAGLALECAKLGFDELLLEEMAYPTAGKLYKINYSNNTMGKTEALTLFLTELRTQLEPYDIKLSLLLSEELLNAGSNADSGQDLAALLPLVDAVYADVPDAAAAQSAIDAAVGESGRVAFVPLTSAALENGQWCIVS